MATLPTPYPPEPHPIAERINELRVTRPWLMFFQQLLNAVNASGGGDVTHTGNLTVNEIVLGNGGADIKVLGSYGTAGDVLISQGAGLPPVFSSSAGNGGMVPYFIPDTDTFIVPLNKQALFQMDIDVEGLLEVDGFLIQVD